MQLANANDNNGEDGMIGEVTTPTRVLAAIMKFMHFVFGLARERMSAHFEVFTTFRSLYHML